MPYRFVITTYSNALKPDLYSDDILFSYHITDITISHLCILITIHAFWGITQLQLLESI